MLLSGLHLSQHQSESAAASVVHRLIGSMLLSA